MRTRRIEVMSREPDAATLKFRCVADGYLVDLSLDTIKRCVADGATLTEHPRSER